MTQSLSQHAKILDGDRSSAIAGARTFDLKTAGLLLLGLLAGLLAQGTGFPEHNNPFHIPIVLGYAHSLEGPHDLFHQGLDNYVSALWPALSLISNDDNVFGVFLTVHVLNRAALLVVLFLCARELVPRKDAVLALACSAVVIVLWAAWALSPFWSDVFHRSLTHTSVAMTMLVASFWLMLRGRWIAAALCLGVAFNINAFVAVWGGAMCAGSYLWVHRRSGRSMLLSGLSRLAAAAIVPALPTFLWIVSTIANAPGSAEFDYRQYLMEIKFPYHNLVDQNWMGLVTAANLGGVVFAYLHQEQLFRERTQRDLVGAFFGVLVAILAIGCLLPYLINSRLLYTLYPLRMDSALVLPLFAVLIASALAASHSRAGREFWLHALVLFAMADGNLPLAVFVSASLVQDGSRAETQRWPDAVATVLLLGSAAFMLATGDVPVYDRWLSGKMVLLVVLVQALLGGLAFRGQPLRFGGFWAVLALVLPALLPASVGPIVAVIVAAVYVATAFSRAIGCDWKIAGAVLLASALAVLFQGGETATMAAAVGAPALGLAVAFLGRAAWSAPLLHRAKAASLLAICAAALVGGVGRLAANGTINYLSPEQRAQVDAELWLRAHSRPDELVLPLGVDAFATLSRRPVWADWQSGSAAMWSPPYYRIWLTRYTEMAGLKTLDQALVYARQHDIPHIVTARTSGISGDDAADAVYKNDYFRIFSSHLADTRPRADRTTGQPDGAGK